MKKLCILAFLLAYIQSQAQMVLPLFEPDPDPELEGLASFFIQNPNDLQSVTITNQGGGVLKDVFQYAQSSDSTIYDSTSHTLRFWREAVLMAEGQTDSEFPPDLIEGGIRLGQWHFWHENGAIRAQGEYTDAGKPVGKWVFMHPNQQLAKIEYYRHFDTTLVWDIDSSKTIKRCVSLLDGEYATFYENGQMAIQGQYKAEIALKDRAYVVYYGMPGAFLGDEQGIAREAKGYLISNRKSGLWRYFDENGQLQQEINFD